MTALGPNTNWNVGAQVMKDSASKEGFTIEVGSSGPGSGFTGVDVLWIASTD